MAHSHSIKQYPGQIMAVAGIAAALGALTAALFTPKKGSELRKAIVEKSKSLKRRNDRIMKAEKDLAKKTADRTKTVAKTTASQAKNTVKATKKDVEDLTDKIRRHGEP